MRGVLLILVCLLLWLASTALLGLAVWLGYFTKQPPNVALLVIGSFIIGWVALVLTVASADVLGGEK